MPYDGALSDAAESMAADNVPIVIGDMQIQGGFDELPIGLCNPYTCTLTLSYGTLKTALKTRLRTKKSGDARNTFLLYSDRGAGATPTTLEFAGVQAVLAGGTLTRGDGGTTTTIELVDALHATMVATTGAQMFAAWDDTASPKAFRLYDFAFNDTKWRRSYADAGFGVSRFADGFRYATQKAIHDHIRGTMSARLKDVAGRTTATGTTVDQSFDSTDDIGNTYDWCRFAAADPAAAPTRTRAAGWLSADTIRRVTTVVDRDGATIGGLSSPADKAGWARYETAWDLHKDLFETAGLKAWYVLSIGTSSGVPFLRARWYVLPCLEPVGGSKPTYSTANALETGELSIEDEAPTIGKAEVRAVYAGKGQPTTDYVVNGGVSRADRSFNVQVNVMTNCPTTKDFASPIRESWRGTLGEVYVIVDAVNRGVMETNTIASEWYEGAFAALLKAHEDTRIHYTAADYVDATNAVSAGVTFLASIDVMVEQVGLWAGQTQALTGLPSAIVNLYATVFGRDDLAYVEITWPLNLTAGTLDDLGHVHNLTGTLATDYPEFGWGTAAKVEQTFDAVAGTVAIKYMLWK